MTKRRAAKRRVRVAALREPEAFWIPADQTLETATFVIYDREHRRGGREVSKDRNGVYLSGWFLGNYTRFDAKDMPDWAIRD